MKNWKLLDIKPLLLTRQVDKKSFLVYYVYVTPYTLLEVSLTKIASRWGTQK